MAQVEVQVPAQQVLSFAVAGGEYAFPLLKVKEILQYEGTTRVPGVPGSILGVLNVRGAVVPVVDLALKFGKPATPITKRTCVLLVETRVGAEPITFGVLAEAVHGVVDLGPGDLEPVPSFGTGVRPDYLVGVGKVGKDFVLLLDAERVLTASEAELAAQAALQLPLPGAEGAAGAPAPPRA